MSHQTLHDGVDGVAEANASVGAAANKLKCVMKLMRTATSTIQWFLFD
jgi:hypothetical protein